MTGATFGRKGMGNGLPRAGASPRRPVFGAAPRAPAVQTAAAPSREEEMAARRAAFLAEERARKTEEGETAEPGSLSPPDLPRVASGPIVIREKSLGAAYALWFFAGTVSAHRFYLGRPVSAVIQVSLWISIWAMILSQNYAAVFAMMAAGLWILADGFLIKSMHRQANEKARERAAYAAVFS